jgi:hypothetical protein
VSESSTSFLERVEKYPKDTLVCLVCPKEEYAVLAARIHTINPGLVVEWVELPRERVLPWSAGGVL